MRFLALIGALFFSFGYFAAAQEAKVTKAICRPGTITKTEQIFESDGGRAALSKISNSENLCYRERITLGGFLGNELKSESTCVCRSPAQLEAVGCEDGKEQPTVTIAIKKEITQCKTDSVVISKCAADPEEAYKEACQSGTNLPMISAGDSRNITIAEAGRARSVPSLGIAPGSETLMKALTASGLSEEKAQELVSQNRQGAVDYIQALANNDTSTAMTKAEALGISTDFGPNQKAVVDVLREQQRKTDPQANLSFYEHGAYESTGGFGENLAASVPSGASREIASGHMQCGVDHPHIGRMMYAESMCGRNTYNPNSNVQGPYQFLCGTWNNYASQTGYGQYGCSCDGRGYYAGRCDAVNDPHITTAVMKSRDAQFESTYGARCAEAGLRWGACSYTIHFAGEAGFNRLLSAYRNDPSTAMTQGNVDAMIVSGAYNANRSVFGRMGSVSEYFRWADNKIYGNSTIIAYGGPSSQPNSPFSGFSGGSFQAAVYNTESPFAQTNLLGEFTAPLAGGLFGNQRRPQNPNQYSQAPYQQPSQQSPIIPPPASAPVMFPPAVATLDIQPRTVSSGGSFVVIWTSVGMNPAQPCVLSTGSTEIARGESGSKRVNATAVGAPVYTLSCAARSGEKVEKSATVTIQ